MATNTSKNFLMAAVLVLSANFAFGKDKKKAEAKAQPILMQIKLGKESLELRIHDAVIADDLQKEFGKEVKIPFGDDEKETLEGYKGVDEQTQRQMLCADINDTVNLLAANDEANTVAAITAKTQRKIFMLKVLQEQVGLTWAHQHFFGKGANKVTLKEIRDEMKVQLPLGMTKDEIKEYFCSPNAEHKASDC